MFLQKSNYLSSRFYHAVDEPQMMMRYSIKRLNQTIMEEAHNEIDKSIMPFISTGTDKI